MATIFKQELPPEFDTWAAFYEVVKKYGERSHFYWPVASKVSLLAIPEPSEGVETWVYETDYVHFRALGFNVSLWGHVNFNPFVKRVFEARKHGATAQEMLNSLLIAIIPLTTPK